MNLPIEPTVASLIVRPMAVGVTTGVAYSSRVPRDEAPLNPIDPCNRVAERSS